MNQGTQTSPTGRLLDKHGVAVVHGRISWSRVTAKQRELLAELNGEPLVLNGREYSTDQLYSIFNGHNLPRDPEALRVMGIDLDYSSIEKRIPYTLQVYCKD